MVAPVPAQITKLRPCLHAAAPRRALLTTYHSPPTLFLPPSSASLSANISPVLNSFRILPVATGVYHSSFPTSDFQMRLLHPECLYGTSRHAKSFVCIGLLPLCRLFALFSAFASFVFNRLEPLSTKHPGWGTPTLLRQASLPRHMRHVAPLSPVPSLDCAIIVGARSSRRSLSMGLSVSRRPEGRASPALRAWRARCRLGSSRSPPASIMFAASR